MRIISYVKLKGLFTLSGSGNPQSLWDKGRDPGGVFKVQIHSQSAQLSFQPSFGNLWKRKHPGKQVKVKFKGNLYEFFFFLLNTKEDILKNVGNQTLVAIDFHSMHGQKCYGGQWLPATVWLPTFLNLHSFLVILHK